MDSMAATKKAAAKKNGNTKPRQDWQAIVQSAIKAQDLATQYAAQLGKRVSPAFLTAFTADLTALNAAVPAAINAHHGAVQLTAAQDAALLNGYNLVAGARTAVRGQTSDNDVLLAYGVGIKVPMLVKHVKTALQKIIDRTTAEPTEAEAFGIVDDDVTAMKDALTLINQADVAQEQARATAPRTFKDRNAIARRLLAGVKRIAGAGMRVFANDPTPRASFAALK